MYYITTAWYDITQIYSLKKHPTWKQFILFILIKHN